MPGYVNWTLKQFQHHKPSPPQHRAFPCAPICYGAKQQFLTQPSTAPPLNKHDKKFIQKVCGKFLFYSRAVDSTILCPISAIASQSTTPTTDTMAQTKPLLNYLATQDKFVITYNHSNVIFATNSDASYLRKPKARSP